MTKLKLISIQDDKPIRLTVSLPAALHRDLVAYAEILARESGKAVEPAKLIAPMLEKFIASDRGFTKARSGARQSAAPIGSAAHNTEKTLSRPPLFSNADRL